jgi:hypothetical protein
MAPVGNELQRKHAKVLLVEGPDDQDVVTQFCASRGIKHQEHFDVVQCGGYAPLRVRVGSELKADRETIGILVDADDVREDRWRSLRDALLKHYRQREPMQSVPEQLASDGLIVESKAWWQKRCGVWVMPDNTQSGMLEDFLLAQIPRDDALLDHATRAVAELPERRFSGKHQAKAEIHTWLAWQKEPGTPLRLAFKRRCFRTDNTLAQRFHDWLVRLFLVDDTSQDRSQAAERR